MSVPSPAKPTHFIRAMISRDIAAKKHDGRVVTRFPPEPNGYLHIGHAKSICLNFGMAEEFPNGRCHLRFDDTNPEKEETEYIRAIEEDLRWLGFDWGENRFFASSYFPRLYNLAEYLIKQGKAYVCSLSAEQVREYRGTLTQSGRNSPFRDRSTEENLDLFRRMRAGEFADGAHILRAKIDMSSPNINMRDPTLYRIRRARHHQTGDEWCIYPTYDYTHCISDALENITHSLCTLEFEDHRPLYDWILAELADQLPCHPQQIEFSRLSLEYTVVSKRKLVTLVEQNHVSGWNDPRMPTLAGLRRRGYSPTAIRKFCQCIGITKTPNNVELALLENCLREDLEPSAPRAMAVLHPLKITLENFPEGKVEEIQAPRHPQREEMGSRTLYFTREIYIDRDDFREQANNKFKRLVAGKEVRLRNAYVIRCQEVIKNGQTGEIEELRCVYDPDTLNTAPQGRQVKGVIHWVAANRCVRAEIRLYNRIFTVPNPDDTTHGGEFTDHINQESLVTLPDCPVEASLAEAQPGDRFQFERLGYFCLDNQDSAPGKLVINQTVTLRDTWARGGKDLATDAG